MRGGTIVRKYTWLLTGHLLLMGLSMPTLAEPQSQADERQQIAQERTRADFDFRQEEQKCLQRFVVTPCVEEARRKHRGVLSDLRQREISLDEELRKQRAAARLPPVDEQPANSDHPERTPQPIVEIKPEDLAASIKTAPPSSVNSSKSPDNSSAQHEQRMLEATRRAQEQQQKKIAHEQRKIRVEKRLQEKAQSSKPAAASLPAPTSAIAPGTAASHASTPTTPRP
jgi:colicin import membrane protein